MQFKRYLPLTALLALVACGTSISSTSPNGLIPPELEIRQLGGSGLAATQASGPTPVNFRIQVFNPSSEDIELERVEIQTIGRGAYAIGNASRPFDKKIPSNETVEVDTWISANANNTIIGVNGPVTRRVTAYFRSPFGTFKKTYMKDVNRDLSPLPKGND